MGTGDLGFGARDMDQSGNGINLSAQQMKEYVTAFKGELDGHGAPWGNDDLGSLIGMCYQVISELALESYDGNVGDLEQHGQGVQVMAANYDTGEQRNITEVNRVREILG